MTILPESSAGAEIADSSSALTLSPADADRAAWARLTDAQRGRVTSKESIFRAIDREIARTGNRRLVMSLCKAHAQRLQTRGFSANRLYCDYFAWLRKGRHWSALVSTGTIERGVAPETVAFIHGFMQRNQRSSEEGWRQFVLYWRDGGEVPGVGTWRDWFAAKWPERVLPRACPPDLPYGWGYENLIRKLDRVETAAARRGIGAALAELPPIPGTRAGMRPLEWITFDDVKLDFRVHVPGLGRPVDVVALVAFDIATGMVLGFGIRPVLLDEDGRGTKLKRRDSKALLVNLLQRWGWAGYGMHIIQELGTAHVDGAYKAALAEATSGLVQVHDASMIVGTVWAGGFADRAVGNSRAKSWLESTFNPLHNKLAAIEGQTGRRYDVAPQDDAGRRKELRALVEAGEKIAPDLRAQFRMPYRSLADASPLLADAIRRLNARTDHAMKDFEEMLVWRFREGDPWMLEHEQLDFAPEQLAHILTDLVPESPEFRYSRLLGAEQRAGTPFFTLHESSAACLLEDQKEIQLDGRQVVFQLEKKTCLYSPYTPANVPVLEAMDPTRRYLAYFDASNGQIPPRVLYVTDGAGRFLGTLEHTAGIRRDSDDAGAAIAKKKSMLRAAVARVNANSPQVAEENLARIEQNLDVLSRAGALEEVAPRLDTTSAAAVAAHTTVAGEVAARAEDDAAFRKVNATKAAQQLTALQRERLSSAEENPSAADDGGWA